MISKVLLLKSSEKKFKDISEIALFTKEQKMMNGGTTVYHN